MNFDFVEDGKFPPFSTQNHLFKTTTALGSLAVSTTDILHRDILFGSLRACTWRKMSYCEGCILYATKSFEMIYTQRERERGGGERDPWREITDL